MDSRLELRWVGKDEKVSLEPRILVKDESKSFSYQPDQYESIVERRGGQETTF